MSVPGTLLSISQLYVFLSSLRSLENLSNLPKVTQLVSCGERNQIQVSWMLNLVLLMTILYFFEVPLLSDIKQANQVHAYFERPAPNKMALSICHGDYCLSQPNCSSPAFFYWPTKFSCKLVMEERIQGIICKNILFFWIFNFSQLKCLCPHKLCPLRSRIWNRNYHRRDLLECALGSTPLQISRIRQRKEIRLCCNFNSPQTTIPGVLKLG